MGQAFQTIVAKLGAPEVLVYNAGPGMKWPPPGILDLDPAVFSRAFDAGVTGALVWAQQVRSCGLSRCAHVSSAGALMWAQQVRSCGLSRCAHVGSAGAQPPAAAEHTLLHC